MRRRGADPNGGNPNAATMATAQSQLQSSLSGLSGVLVREMNGLLQDRLNRLDTGRLQALITVGVLVLLVLLAFILQLIGRHRGISGGDHIDRGMSGSPDRTGGSYGGGLLDPTPQYGEVNPTRRERSGVLR